MVEALRRRVELLGLRQSLLELHGHTHCLCRMPLRLIPAIPEGLGFAPRVLRFVHVSSPGLVGLICFDLVQFGWLAGLFSCFLVSFFLAGVGDGWMVSSRK